MKGSADYAKAAAKLKASRPDMAPERVHQVAMAAAVMHDPALHEEGRAKLGKAAFDDALHQLVRDYGDLVPDFRPRPVKVNPDTLPLPKREREQFRAIAGENADRPVDRVGDQYAFRDSSGGSAVMDASSNPPRIFREVGGIRAEMPGVSEEFSRVHASSLELDRLERDLVRLQNVDREKLVQGIFRIADETRIETDEQEAKEPEKLVDRVRGELERKRDEADKGNPPVSPTDGQATAAPVASFDDLATEAERTPPDRKAAESFEARLARLDDLGKRLEENTAAIRAAETELARVREASELARRAFDERLRASDAQARENIGRVEGVGGNHLGQVGITALIDILNDRTVRSALNDPPEIDLAEELKPAHMKTIMWGLGVLFDAPNLFDEQKGALKPGALMRPEALRAKLMERSILDADGSPNLRKITDEIEGAVKALFKHDSK